MIELHDFDLSVKIKPTNPRILLDSGPPRALYKVNPRLILGKEWWDQARRKAYHDYCNCCAACGISNVKLEAHEMYKIDNKKGKVTIKDIVPLCSDCHSFVHQDLHRALLKKRELTTDDVVRILKHGRKVLANAKLRYWKQDPNKGDIAHNDWRLVLLGKEYKPVFMKGVSDE